MKPINQYIQEKLIIKKTSENNKEIEHKYLDLPKSILDDYYKYESENRSNKKERNMINDSLTKWVENSGVFPKENQIYEIVIDEEWSFCLYNTTDIIGITYIKHIKGKQQPLYTSSTTCSLKKSRKNTDYIPSIVHKYVSVKHDIYYCSFVYDYDDSSTAFGKFNLYNDYEVYKWDIKEMIQ